MLYLSVCLRVSRVHSIRPVVSRWKSLSFFAWIILFHSRKIRTNVHCMILGGSIITGGRNSSSHKNCEEFDKMNVLLCIISMKISSSININLPRAMLRGFIYYLIRKFHHHRKKSPTDWQNHKSWHHLFFFFSYLLTFLERIRITHGLK